MARVKKGDRINGWIALDKPAGLTSTRAVSIIRRLFNAQKAGHAGTLDPLATGMLPIALGEATKTVAHMVDAQKIYEFTLKWGEETDTGDTEGTITETSDKRPDETAVRDVLEQFRGEITQTPPRYSAILIDGERAYDLARHGEEFEIPSRQVEIFELELLKTSEIEASFRTRCGKGTYIRSLARDIARQLGTFAHIINLRRLSVGTFCADDMIKLEMLEELGHKGDDRSGLMECLLPIETVLDDIPACAVDLAEANRLRQGQAVILRGRDAPVHQELVLVKNRKTPVALASIECGMLKPKRVFNLGK